MMQKNTVVVRTNAKRVGRTARELNLHKVGSIFITIQNSNANCAYYNEYASITQGDYRLATDLETEYFINNPTITHINEIPKSFLINKTNTDKQDEKRTIINSGPEGQRQGNVTISNPRRQIYTGSRYTGNSKTAKYQKKRIGISQIKSTVCTI